MKIELKKTVKIINEALRRPEVAYVQLNSFPFDQTSFVISKFKINFFFTIYLYKMKG